MNMIYLVGLLYLGMVWAGAMPLSWFWLILIFAVGALLQFDLHRDRDKRHAELLVAIRSIGKGERP